MSNYQGKHTKKETTNDQPTRRVLYRDRYIEREQNAAKQAPVDEAPKVAPAKSEPNEEENGRSYLLPLVLIIVLVLGLLVFFLGDSQGWWNGGRQSVQSGVVATTNPPKPMLTAQNAGKPTEQVEVTPTEEPTQEPTEEPTEVPTEEPTEEPTEAPTEVPTEEPTQEPTAEPTVIPTQEPTLAPTLEPTAEPERHASYTITGSITFTVNRKQVMIQTFEYAGGYIPADDPRYSEEEMEADGSYGPSLEDETIEDGIFNWLHELPKSSLQVVRARVQTGLEPLESLYFEDLRAWQIARLSEVEYDEIANETLRYLFEGLNGAEILTATNKHGTVKLSTDWSLENFMVTCDDEAEFPIEVHGRENGDDDVIAEEKDTLFTILTKNGKNLISAPQGLINTANDAGVDSRKYDVTAWVNLKEGGTWKWKPGHGPTAPPTNPPPTEPPTPTDEPTPVPPTDPPTTTPPPTDPPATPTPEPTSTPTDPPTPVPPTPTPTDPPTPEPTPEPTKSPPDRPQESDAPVGHGPTNPENATDPPKPDPDPTSTPYVEPTPAPATPEPEPAPTAVVGPTVDCGEGAPELFHEDYQEQNPTPAPEPTHNVPEQGESISEDENAIGDFDSEAQ